MRNLLAALLSLSSLVPLAVTAQVSSLNEGFEGDLSNWVVTNNSTRASTGSPWDVGVGITDADGNIIVTPYDGAQFAIVNYTSVGSGTGTISNWLISSQLQFGPNATLSFYTTTTPSSDYPDRLEVRVSANGASSNVGATTTSVGDFTTVLTTVNSGLTVGGYPETWTLFTVTGLPTSGTGRIAFRYYVTSGGPTGDNSNIIGLDDVAYSIPTATTYHVGGSATGLSGTGLVLQLNGANDLAVNANGTFTFASTLASNATYNVTVLTPPSGQTCQVDNGTGTVQSVDITNVQVTCTTTVVPPQLTLSFTDGSDYASYGQTIDYVATLSNAAGAGAATNVTVLFTLSSGLDATAATVSCTAAGGATCPATPALSTTVASLPPAGTLTFTLSVPVVADTAEPDVTVSASATGATTVDDVDTVVIFHDGFDSVVVNRVAGLRQLSRNVMSPLRSARP